MASIDRFKKHIEEKKAVKVISGIDNFDIENVKKVVAAADQAKASAVDVAANKEIIYIAKQITDIPVIVSSICPQALLMAKNEGADGLELGNFDALYKKGARMSADEVYKIAKETRELVGNDIFFCVTIPGHIDIKEQIELARKLESLNVDLLQTEGAATIETKESGARALLEKANASIANTVELARNTSIPIMTASGITTTTAKMAFAAGASAIGVGSAINKQHTTLGMIATSRTLIELADIRSEDFALA